MRFLAAVDCPVVPFTLGSQVFGVLLGLGEAGTFRGAGPIVDDRRVELIGGYSAFFTFEPAPPQFSLSADRSNRILTDRPEPDGLIRIVCVQRFRKMFILRELVLLGIVTFVCAFDFFHGKQFLMCVP